MLRFTHVLPFVLCLVSFAAPARAQEADLANCKDPRVESLTAIQFPVKNEQGIEQTQMVLTGSPQRPARADCSDMSLQADQIVVYDRHIVVATGNVLFVSDTNRIAADRLEFETTSRTGTFFNASGTVSLEATADRTFFDQQEPDAYFRGEEIHKLGPDTYRVVNGAFTTCVQPTPRWEMVVGSVTLRVDHHALLKNAVMRVKGVPVMYLPIFYYPINKEDRSTGFLLPVYGASTVRGQSLSNAFFWAIDRSQDATITHDWYTKTGQAIGGQYRYELGGGNRGNADVNFLNEHAADYLQSDGTVRSSPAGSSFFINGGLSQALPAGLHARANVNYTSSLEVQQRYQQNVLQINNRTRTIGGNVTGNWSGYVMSATFDKNDVFYDEKSYSTTGGLPRVSLSRGERQIARSKIYFGVNGEYVTQIYKTVSEGVTTDDRGLTRTDVNPYIRIPFTKWPFLSVNSTVSWRDTYWSESLDPASIQVPVGVNRTFFDLRARLTGPVFNRIFDTPNSHIAQKFKHVIEPVLDIQRVTAIENFNEIVKIDGSDSIVGGTTTMTYGLNNRLYAKRTTSKEIVSVGISQSYYTNATAAQYDPNYNSSFNGLSKPTNFSPIRIVTRVSPSDRFQSDFSTEFNTSVNMFTTFTATGSMNSTHLQLSGGWSRRRLIPELPDYSNPALANHDINAMATIRNASKHLGGIYQFNYDLYNNGFRQQRVMAFYNAQCCGVQVEYQTYNLGGVSSFVVPQDNRFNLSFTLAGIGTFSNFFGAFGGQQGRY